MENKPRLLRITTVPISLNILLHGQLSFFQSQGFEVLAVSADGKEVDEIRKEGIAHRVVPMTRKITPLRDLISLVGIIRVIRRFKPDIVHTHTPKAGLLGMIAAWVCGIPVRMHTVAGLPLMEAKGLKRQILMLTEKITYACATAIYPNSKGLANFIRNHFSTRTPVIVLGNGSSNGIDTSRFQRTAQLEDAASALRQQYGIPREALIFSFVGRVVGDKGVRELAEAFRGLRRTFSESYLLLIGGFEDDLDPLDPEVLSFLKNDPKVILAGFQSDIRPWVMVSDIFVFPSYREGFPNVVMQACCLNTPCIVSDINGCNEIVSDGKTGLIVPPKNSAMLQLAMEKLSVDPALRRKFAAAAREYVVANFDQKFVWGELLKEYSRVLR
jgi:glycosyltransferase involved in cell wall biosynthesis